MTLKNLEIDDNRNLIPTFTDDPQKIQSKITRVLKCDEMVAYARIVLSEEQFDAIWEKWIRNEGMTTEKLDIIGGERWNEYSTTYSLHLIETIGAENLSNPKMTADKLTVIVYSLWVEDIERVWAKELAEMSMAELNELV